MTIQEIKSKNKNKKMLTIDRNRYISTKSNIKIDEIKIDKTDILSQFTGLELNIRDSEKMEEDHEEMFDKRDFRKKKDKKRQHKEKEECTRESFKKMKEEIDELRRKEVERTKELEELKKKIDDKQIDSADSKNEKEKEEEYALNFDKNAYLSKGFIESAVWIKNVLAKSLLEKVSEERNVLKFASIMKTKKTSGYLGYRACARYNRREECNLGKWHLTHKPDGLWTKQRQQELNQSKLSQNSRTNDGDQPPKRNELRLHVCTLCLEAFGSANGHSILNCPWIKKNSWED